MSQSTSQSMMPAAASARQDTEVVPAMASTSAAPRKKARRGFAAMSPDKQKEIARKGGRASHEKGTGHEWTSESARTAGRKGGLASHGPKD